MSGLLIHLLVAPRSTHRIKFRIEMHQSFWTGGLSRLNLSSGKGLLEKAVGMDTVRVLVSAAK